MTLFWISCTPVMAKPHSPSNRLHRYVDLHVASKWKTYWENENANPHPIDEGHLPYKKCFIRSAKKNQVPLSLLVAVAKGESGFNPKARSKANAVGIMQIIWPETARWLGVSSLSELEKPCINIEAGAKYLKFLIKDIFNDNVHLVVASYNYGHGGILKQLKRKNRISPGAIGYSSYIYYHLEQILAYGALAHGGLKKYVLLNSEDEMEAFLTRSQLDQYIEDLEDFIIEENAKSMEPFFLKEGKPFAQREKIINNVEVGGYKLKLKWLLESELAI